MSEPTNEELDAILRAAGMSPHAHDRYDAMRAAFAAGRRAQRGSKAWEGLFNERNRLWRAAEDKLTEIGEMLRRNGCDCECDCDSDGHNDDCEPCLACQISYVLQRKPSAKETP